MSVKEVIQRGRCTLDFVALGCSHGGRRERLGILMEAFGDAVEEVQSQDREAYQPEILE